MTGLPGGRWARGALREGELRSARCRRRAGQPLSPIAIERPVTAGLGLALEGQAALALEVAAHLRVAGAGGHAAATAKNGRAGE